MKTILIVDDNVKTRNALRRMFAGKGFHVETASSFSTAKQAVMNHESANQPFDEILSDFIRRLLSPLPPLVRVCMVPSSAGRKIREFKHSQNPFY